MTGKTRKKLNELLSSLLKLYHEVHDERILDAATALAVILPAEEEESKDYVPTAPPDQPHSPWDWWEGLRPKTPANPMKPGDTPTYIGGPGDTSPYTYGPSDGIPGQTFYSSYRECPMNLCDSCEHCKKDKKNKKNKKNKKKED